MTATAPACCQDPDAHRYRPCPWTPGATVVTWTKHGTTRHLGILANPPTYGPCITDDWTSVIERPTGARWLLPPGTATVFDDPSGTRAPGDTL